MTAPHDGHSSSLPRSTSSSSMTRNSSASVVLPFLTLFRVAISSVFIPDDSASRRRAISDESDETISRMAGVNVRIS